MLNSRIEEMASDMRSVIDWLKTEPGFGHAICAQILINSLNKNTKPEEQCQNQNP